MLKQIKPNDTQEKYIILTPDRRTLITEQQLFETLQTEAFFNVNVTTLTRFATQTISELGRENKRVLTKPGAVAIIKKIMLEQQPNLKAFAKATRFSGTASAIFDTISMFKSCNVNPSQLQPTFQNVALNNKVEDLKLIYEKYETYLQTEYTDSFNKLTLLSQLLKDADLSHTHFLWVGFDDFTPQTYEILGKLMVKASSVLVACSANFDKTPNKELFTNNTYYNLMDTARMMGVKPNTVQCKPKYTTEKEHLAKNLFATLPQVLQGESNLAQVVKFESKEHEVEFVAKTILWQVSRGMRMKDFVVLVPNISSYLPILKQTFKQYDIPMFVDENKAFSDHVLIRFIVHLFEIVNQNSTPESVLALLKTIPNLSANLIAEYETILQMSGLQGQTILTPLVYKNLQEQNQLLQPIYDVLKQVVGFVKNTKGNKTVFSWVEQLQNFLTQVGWEQMVQEYAKEYQQTDVLQYRLLLQVQTKLQTSLQDVASLLQEYECDFSSFSEILIVYLQNISLSLPPLAVDTVFVADSVASFVYKPHTMFCLGANAGVLPVALNDLGIIRDEEINKLKEFARLTPTVAMINKRNKLLLYEKLLQTQNKLYVTYTSVTEKGETLLPSAFITGLLQMFEHTKNSLVQQGEVLLQKTSLYDPFTEKNMQRTLFNNPSVKSASENFIQLLKDWTFYNQDKVYLQYVAMLNQLLEKQGLAKPIKDNAHFKNVYDVITHAKELYFSNDTTSVSQFETYFTCPFKHFVDYGLKLQEASTSEIDARQFGNMLHEYVALLLPLLVAEKQAGQVLTDQDLQKLAEQVFEKVLKNPDYELVVNNPYNYHALKALRAETKRVATHLFEMEQHSQFKPVAFEKMFGKTKDSAIVLDTEKGKVYLKGIIDRVDEFENTYRIIDYKSGKSEFSNFTETVSGKKVQLFVYMLGYESGDKKCVGSFYLPLKDDFVKVGKDAQELYRLKGVVQNSLQTIFAMDDSLAEPSVKSKILPLETKKDGEFTKPSLKYLLSESDLEWISNYVMILLKQAYLKMISGNIEPHPLKLTNDQRYEQPKLIGLNNFNLDYGNEFRKIESVPNFNKEQFLFELNVFSKDLGMQFTEQFTLTDKTDK